MRLDRRKPSHVHERYVSACDLPRSFVENPKARQGFFGGYSVGIKEGTLYPSYPCYYFKMPLTESDGLSIENQERLRTRFYERCRKAWKPKSTIDFMKKCDADLDTTLIFVCCAH